jgi:hypothetical protein
MNWELREEFERIIKMSLTNEDDLEFWTSAFETLIQDVSAFELNECRKYEIFIQIGACSHWLRPHQKRWTAAGGFAWPVGYLQRAEDHIKNSWGPIGSGLPELDWFVLMHWNRESGEWQMVTPKFFGKKKLILRVALPSNTLRHHQAAIHTIWSPESPELLNRKVEELYGFRKLNGQWQCVAKSREKVILKTICA